MRSRFIVVVAVLFVGAAGCATKPTSVESGGLPTATAAEQPVYSCDVGPTFTADQLWIGAGTGDDGASLVLNDAIRDNGWPRTEWRRVADEEDAVLFLHGETLPMAYVLAEPADRGWRMAGGGTCVPSRIRDGMPSASWTLSPDSGLDMSTRTFTALVRERGSCTDGRPPAARVSEPEIIRTENRVTVTFFLEPPRSAPEACSWEESQPTEVVVDLGESLGERELLDGAFSPPRLQGRSGPGWGTASCDTEPGSEHDLSAEPHPAIADYIHRWSRNGCFVRIDVLATSTPGPDFHCAPWPQSLTMATPLGSTDQLAERLTYVRSTEEQWRAQHVTVAFSADVAPPTTAAPTGYLSFDGAELLIDETTQDVVYLRYPGHTERWPRMAGVGCA